MTDELKADVKRILTTQFSHGYNAGYEDGRAFKAAAHRDNVVIAFVIGALLGLLAGWAL